MLKPNRREFFTLAGAGSIGLALAAKVDAKPARNARRKEKHFDAWVEVDSKAVAWNVKQVRARVDSRPIMAVIKCNAYGHGLVGFAKILQQQDINRFAVVKAQEAMALRDAGINDFVLNFGPFTTAEADYMVRHDICQSVFSNEIGKLTRAARKAGKKAKVHVKVDTGLGRIGVPHERALRFIEKLSRNSAIKIEGIFTTLTEETEFDKVQIARLLSICEQAKNKGISVGVRHAASSHAVANYPGAFLDMVRPGNCLFGLKPMPNLDLRPSISLKTRVLFIKKMKPGDTVSYGRHFTVEKDTLMATLPVGYTDGYPHRAVGKADVLIKGKRWPMVAYVSANHATIDITGSKGIKIGDEVVLIGTQKKESISLSDIAKWGESSTYKSAIALNPLLPRIYK